MNTFILGLILFVTVGVTFTTILLQRLGFEPNYLFIALGAVLVAGLLVYRGVLLILLAIAISVSLSLPTELLQQYSIDRDVLIVVQILMILFPISIKGASKVSFS
jgi:hypothetical protein